MLGNLDYYVVTDPFPQQDQQSTRLYPFYESLRNGRLTTTQCLTCTHVSWPPRVLCPKCHSDHLDWVQLSNKGKVHGFTIQEVGVPPGFASPLVFAVVHIDSLLVFSRIVECQPSDLSIGMDVMFTTISIPGRDEQRNRILHAFKPEPLNKRKGD